MADSWFQKNAPPTAGGWFAQNAPPAVPRPAGLPAGVDLPGFTSHAPAPRMDAPDGTIAGNWRYGAREVPSDGSQTNGSRIEAGLQNFGGRVARGIAAPFQHPGDFVRGTVKSSLNIMDPRRIGPPESVKNAAQQAHDEYSNSSDKVATMERIGGDLGANLLLSEAGGRALAMAPRAVAGSMTRLGEAAQDSGATRMDTYLNGGKPLDPGNGNPGRAVLQEGPGTSLALSRNGQLPRIQATLGPAGQAVGDAVAGSTAQVPWADVRSVVDSAISRKQAIASGPGGNPNLSTRLGQLRTTFEPAIDDSGNASMQDLYAGRRSMDQNVNWNRGPDPVEATVRNATREIRGGTKDLMYEADPSLVQPNERYANLKTAADLAEDNVTATGPRLFSLKRIVTGAATGAGAGMLTHSPTLGGIVGAATEMAPAIRQMPIVQTGLAAGAYQAGRLLQSSGELASRLPVGTASGLTRAVPLLASGSGTTNPFGSYTRNSQEDDAHANELNEQNHYVPYLPPAPEILRSLKWLGPKPGRLE